MLLPFGQSSMRRTRTQLLHVTFHFTKTRTRIHLFDTGVHEKTKFEIDAIHTTQHQPRSCCL